METSLHRDLKALYAGEGAQTEVRLGGYRIDAVVGEQLIEIQHSALGAIRDKIRKLLTGHDVLVVKPIVVEKTLVKLDRKDGIVVERRRSPRRGKLLDVFDDLVHFSNVFPHPRLELEVVLLDSEDWRYPGHGRRRRRRAGDHVSFDERLVEVREVHRFRTAADLQQAFCHDCELPQQFHTGHLAEAWGVRRFIAQRAAYCLRKTGAIQAVGKQGNAWLYQLAAAPAARKRRRRAA